ncbi:hypothetical protein [Winogradskyella endarachnes]|uniref:Lipoprotein n=1 Tax=Winogradskyella endarachnes TaxID=2681965 RepID=A0A6L6U809_9FLAO|nr:hypothetical protein [Winogradskyella endarachnes]MUU78435.1 hypothetical protein [Winogradskyella endarachnes]
MNKVLKYITFVLILSSCASKKLVQKLQLQSDISKIKETTYAIENGNKTQIELKHIELTKNGRVKYSETFNEKNDLIETVEKKLFFNKKSFPNKEPYYCKTRWKFNQKERISCYSQKTDKQNEIIVQYNKDGTVKHITDNFTTFNKYIYRYGTTIKSDTLLTIITLNKDRKETEKTTLRCLEKDASDNCIELQKTYNSTQKIEIIERDFTYN